jgi:multidrug resistance efflux pump
MSKLSVIGLLLVAFAVPASSQEKRPRGDQPKDLPDAVARAEAEVAIKRAAVKVADAQKRIAEAKLNVIKTRLPAAEAMEALAKDHVQRLKQLAAAASVANEEVRAAEARLQSAMAGRLEAQGNVLVGEAEVALELARREMAEAELQEAELRARQLRERLKLKK